MKRYIEYSIKNVETIPFKSFSFFHVYSFDFYLLLHSKIGKASYSHKSIRNSFLWDYKVAWKNVANASPKRQLNVQSLKRNTRTRCEICLMLTIKTPERHQWRRSVVFIVNFEHISHLALVFLLLTLKR